MALIQLSSNPARRLSLVLAIIVLVRLPHGLSIFLHNGGAVFLNVAFTTTDSRVRAKNVHLSDVMLTALTVRSEDLRVARLEGMLLLLQGKERGAARSLEASGETVSDFVNRGNANSQFAIAEMWYRLALSVIPDYADAWYHLGVLYGEHGRPKRAVSALETGLDSERHEAIGRSDFLLHIGYTYLRQSVPQDPFRALTALNQAIEQNDFAVENINRAYFLRATALRRLGHHEEAIEDYRRLIENNPGHYWAHVRLASELWRFQGKYPEAERLLLRAVDLNEEQEAAYRDLAELYTHLDRRTEAERLYGQLLSIDPQNSAAQEALRELQE